MGRVIRVDYADPSKKASSGSPLMVTGDRDRGVDSMRMVIDKAERKVTYSNSASAVPILREKPPMRRTTSTNVGRIDADDVVDDDDDDDDDPLEQLMESTPAIVNSSGSSSSSSSSSVKVKVYNDRKETSRNDDRSKSWSEDAQWNIRNKQQRYEGRSSTSKYGDREGGDRDGGDRSKASSSPVRPRTRPMTSSSPSSSSVNRSPSSRSSSSSSSPPRYEATLYFGNLAYAVTEAVLKAEIERFTGDSSSVAAVRIATDLETGRKKGFGYVDVFKKEVAAKVIIIMMVVMIMMIRMMMMMMMMI